MNIVIEIDPASADIVQASEQSAMYVWKTQQFKAYLHDDPTNLGVTWEIGQGGGDIDSRGVFTPPVTYSSWGKTTIVARSVADKTKTGSAVVTYR